MKLSTCILWIFLVTFNASAQDFGAYEKKYFVVETDTLPYRLLLPENYDAKKSYPLIFFMHGAGERGNDNERQLMHGGKLFLQSDTRKNYPAIVVFPQCAATSFWSNVAFNRDSAGKNQFNFIADRPMTQAMQLAQGLLYQLIHTYPVKKEQVYVAGLSMGGMGTFELVGRNPLVFAAATPICGGGNPATAEKMTGTDWWIFHGEKDDEVPVSLSHKMNDALKKAGANVKLTIYPGTNHNSWDQAFAEPGLLKWLFTQRR